MNFDKIKAQAEENPLAAMAVCALVFTTVTKFMNAVSGTRNSRTWAREVNRRVKSGRK